MLNRSISNINREEFTMEKLTNDFLVYQQYKNNSPATIVYYRVTLEMFDRYLKEQGITLIDDVNINILRSYVLYLKNRTCHENNTFSKPKKKEIILSKSVQTYTRAVKCFLNYLYGEGYIQTDFNATFKLPKATKRVIEILSDEEIKKILNHYNLDNEMDCRNYIIMSLTIDSGLRLSELVRLEVNDICIEQGFIKVSGKGDKERIVPIDVYSQKAMLKYINFLRSEPISPNIKSFFLCIDKTGITQDTVKMMLKRLANVLNIPRLHPHLCRHTFATKYLLGGGNLFTLQQILGHTSLEMVRNYSHLAASHATVQHRQLSPIDNLMMNK